MPPQKTPALSSICSVLFRCTYELLCFWMRREGIEIFHRSPLRENSGSMQFVEAKKRSSQSPRELKFACYVSGQKISEKSFKWRAYVVSGGVPTRFSMANTLAKLKKSSSWMISSVSKEEVFLHSLPLAQNRTKQILRCNNQANEFLLPRRWNQWKHWAKLQQFGAKRDCLHIF